jgi:protein-tyrosine phosphatase
MVDYHCHILPGIDDGAATLDEALEIARCLADAGFAAVHCTPHCIRGLYEPTPDQVRSAVASLQRELQRAAIPLKVLPGMEYYIDEFFLGRLADPLVLGESRLLLVEIPGQGDAERVSDALLHVMAKGLVPLIAHPERTRLLDDASARSRWGSLWRRSENAAPTGILDTLCRQGALLQGNLGSLAGYYGPQVRERACELLRMQRYHCFGSDAHAASSLRTFLSAGLQGVAAGNN